MAGKIISSTWRISSVLLVVILFVGFALAAHIITTSEGTTSKNILEDVSSIINITVENGDVGGDTNITEVNITLPGGVVFISDTNDTSAGREYSTNTSNSLNWLNASGMVYNGAVQSFWFNVTISTPGRYNITVGTLNNSGTALFSQNITIVVNDTTVPSSVALVSPTQNSGVNVSQSSIPVNTTFVDNGVLSAIVINLYNTTGLVNATSSSTNSSWYANFTGLPDGVYYYNVTANDTYNNRNNSITKIVTLDTTLPVLGFGSRSESDGINVSRSSIYLNVTLTEVNEHTITFNLYNSTGLVNSSFSRAGQRAINFSGLIDNVYYYNVTVNDTAGNVNNTATRIITLDTTLPVLGFGSRSESDGINVSRSSIYLNVTLTEVNEHTITFNLYNSTGLVNSSFSRAGQRAINFSGLIDHVYYYNVTVNDTAGNVNNTATRMITLDTTAPSSISFPCSPTTISQGGTITCSCSAVDALDPNPTLSYTVNPSTSTLGDFITTCTATDDAGNIRSANVSYTVIPVLAGGSSSSSSGGGSSSGVTTYVVTNDQLATGYQQEISTSSRLQFSAGGAVHYVSLGSVSGNSATITVTSTPQTATLSVGESKNFELNGDNFYDVAVTLVRALSGKATVSVKAIHEAVPTVPETAQPEEPKVREEPAQQEAAPEPEQQSEETSSSVSTIAIVLVVVIVLVIFWLIFRRKK